MLLPGFCGLWPGPGAGGHLAPAAGDADRIGDGRRNGGHVHALGYAGGDPDLATHSRSVCHPGKHDPFGPDGHAYRNEYALTHADGYRHHHAHAEPFGDRDPDDDPDADADTVGNADGHAHPDANRDGDPDGYSNADLNLYAFADTERYANQHTRKLAVIHEIAPTITEAF